MIFRLRKQWLGKNWSKMANQNRSWMANQNAYIIHKQTNTHDIVKVGWILELRLKLKRGRVNQKTVLNWSVKTKLRQITKCFHITQTDLRDTSRSYSHNKLCFIFQRCKIWLWKKKKWMDERERLSLNLEKLANTGKRQKHAFSSLFSQKGPLRHVFKLLT